MADTPHPQVHPLCKRPPPRSACSDVRVGEAFRRPFHARVPDPAGTHRDLFDHAGRMADRPMDIMIGSEVHGTVADSPRYMNRATGHRVGLGIGSGRRPSRQGRQAGLLPNRRPNVRRESASPRCGCRRAYRQERIFYHHENVILYLRLIFKSSDNLVEPPGDRKNLAMQC